MPTVQERFFVVQSTGMGVYYRFISKPARGPWQGPIGNAIQRLGFPLGTRKSQFVLVCYTVEALHLSKLQTLVLLLPY